MPDLHLNFKLQVLISANNDATRRSNANASLNVIISEDGTTSVNIHKALLGSALMVNNDNTTTSAAMAAAKQNAAAIEAAGGANAKNGLIQLATDDLRTLENTGGGSTHHTAAAFTQALENIASLRATNGGQVQRLMYAQANVDTQVSNLIAANGRIGCGYCTGVFKSSQATGTVQAAASMTAQANVANDVALMLLQ